MTIPINQKAAVLVTNIDLYIAAKQPLEMAMGSWKDGQYKIRFNGSYITPDEYRYKLKEVEKILRPVNWKGENRDKVLSASIGFINN